ncbi:MAG: hypothetical protein OHK0029_28000 [Armatimonadaceae bacterium]
MAKTLQVLVPVFLVLIAAYAGALSWAKGEVEAVQVNERFLGSVGPREQEMLKQRAAVELPRRQTVYNMIMIGGGLCLLIALGISVSAIRRGSTGNGSAPPPENAA